MPMVPERPLDVPASRFPWRQTQKVCTAAFPRTALPIAPQALVPITMTGQQPHRLGSQAQREALPSRGAPTRRVLRARRRTRSPAGAGAAWPRGRSRQRQPRACTPRQSQALWGAQGQSTPRTKRRTPQRSAAARRTAPPRSQPSKGSRRQQ
eukprot:Amastigsp_a343192_39.p3 type:complete len:152 gc:universal Amastigsp_a343192_39:887-1342(+)